MDNIPSHIVPREEVPSILSQIRKLRRYNEIYGRDCKSLVMSKIIYSVFREECIEEVGIPGDVTMYLGMNVVVLDRDDTLIMIG